MRTHARRGFRGIGRLLAIGLTCGAAAAQPVGTVPGNLPGVLPRAAPAASAPEAAPAQPLPAPPSSLARRIYDQHRDKLVQVRVIVAGSESQASAGSAFSVSPDGLLVTNYHVISQLVQEPDRYRAEFVRTDGVRGPLQILAIDVQHDLAVVQVGAAQRQTPWPVMTLAPDDSLRQGDKVLSLGNPLDLGFAISEGTYNGLPERSLYPHLLFTGAMNPGVSGGPALDDEGRVVGVNVAGYGRSAELTNFQVPVRFVKTLLARAQVRAATGKPVTNADLRAEMLAQLMAHQNLMLDRMQTGNWRTQPLGPYRVPVIPDTLARCWGDVSNADKRSYRLETARCSLDSARYIKSSLQVGSVSTQHEVVTSDRLGALRLSAMRSQSMSNEGYHVAGQTRDRTASRCTEDFVRNTHLPLRVVVCARAYRKLEGLYDVSTVVVTLDSAQSGLESVLQLNGVAYARAMQESRRFVEAIGRSTAK